MEDPVQRVPWTGLGGFAFYPRGDLVVVVVLAVIVAPIPVFFLFLRGKLAKFAVGIAVIFACPLVIKHHFVVVPHMVITVVGVIGPIIVMRATQAQRRPSQGGAETKRPDKTGLSVHLSNSPPSTLD